MMFDFAPYYSKIANELPDNCRIVEVGVANGDSALYLASAMYNLEKKFELFLVDNMAYGGMKQLNDLWRAVANTGLHKSITIIPEDSVEASKMFNDNSLHFVFIDSSHEYQETKDSIKAWMPKLYDGFKLAGHDYDLYPEVRRAVNELVPMEFLRAPILTETHKQFFRPHKLLNIIGTDDGYGIWEFKKDFYIKLNDV